MKILIINGPNLNLLGEREPEIYGSLGFDGELKKWQEKFHNEDISYFQSNIEGELIDKIQEARNSVDAIIINAGGYTHTSVAIGDALGAINLPTIEVHISNVYAREAYRHESKLAHRCLGVISGLGMNVYKLAIEHLAENAKDS